MEQHPVPQNVTTFQFRLIGDMTIKQFGYLAGGIIVGYICYKLPLPFFFTWPLAITSGLLGFGLAFVPVEERPMDIWIASFFRNTYSPTQWIWSREVLRSGISLRETTSNRPVVPVHKATLLEQFSGIFFAWLQPVITTTGPGPAQIKSPTKVPSATQTVTPPIVPAIAPKAVTPSIRITSPHHGQFPIFEWFASLFRNRPAPTPTLTPGFSFADAFDSKNNPSISGGRPPSAAEVAQKTSVPHQPISPLASASGSAATTSTQPPHVSDGHQHIASLQGQLTEVMRDRERLEKELVAMRQKMDRQAHALSPQPMRQATTTPAARQVDPTVRIIAPGAAVKAGIPQLTTFPNVVTGIVKDQYGNLLAGMLITVRDHDDVPLRALKTNRLGQFAASTPLPNNTYIVEIEDPKGGFIFDRAQIQLGGAVAPPLEITAKSQKQVERDRLAKEIFGNTQI